MKLYFTVFLILSFSIAGAQIKSGIINYKVSINFEPDKKTENDRGVKVIEKMFKDNQEDIGRLETVLEFNQNESLYYLKEQMERETAMGFGSVKTILKLDNIFYTNLDNEELLKQSEAFENTYLIYDKPKKKTDWNITSQSKSIGKFKVYKATTIQVVKNSKGVFKSPVIAWFAPEIPFSFGPIGYGGLPGLILELEIQSNFPAIYTAVSTEFNEEGLIIEPPKGDRITPEEMDDMYKKARGAFKRD